MFNEIIFWGTQDECQYLYNNLREDYRTYFDISIEDVKGEIKNGVSHCIRAKIRKYVRHKTYRQQGMLSLAYWVKLGMDFYRYPKK